MKERFKFTTALPEMVKQKQYLILGGIISGFIVIVSSIVIFSDKKAENALHAKENTEKRIEVSKLAGGAKTEHRLVIEYDKAIKELNKEVEHQKAENENINSKVDQLNETLSSKPDDRGAIDDLNLQIQMLKDELTELRLARSQPEQQVYVEKPAPKIVDHNISLEGANNNLTTHNLEHYVPAGSYVSAMVISGVDASVGVNSQSEPRPVLFRVIGKAKTAAKDGYVEKVDLDGCTVTGAAMGDLSSERVFVRLLKMTCAKDTERVVETEVQGYVAGLGKAGIRGDVVSREGDFVMQSFLAGIATSAGNGIAQKYSSPFALTAQQPSTTDVVGSSVGGGVSNATNRLSDYLIKRAEQYQPVISMPSGIDVELVFHDGFYIDGNKNRNTQNNPQEVGAWQQSSN